MKKLNLTLVAATTVFFLSTNTAYALNTNNCPAKMVNNCTGIYNSKTCGKSYQNTSTPYTCSWNGVSCNASKLCNPI